MKFKKLFLLGALMTFALCANAQLLWKVTKEGSPKTSYVLGSHHVAPASMLDEVQGLKEAIAQVDAVYGEVKKEAMNSPEAQQKMMMIAMAPADSTITMLMSKEQLDSLDAMLARYTGMSGMVSQLAMVKPTMIDTQLGMLMNMKVFPGFDPSKQFDVTVMTLGENEGKEIDGFEDLDFQLNLLFGAPISEQVEDLLNTMRNEQRLLDYSAQLAEAYKTQNLDEIYTIITDPELGLVGEDLDRMLLDRNANWVEQLKTLLPQKSILMVVGSGHLPGDKGLLQLLRNQGYTVEPMGK